MEVRQLFKKKFSLDAWFKAAFRLRFCHIISRRSASTILLAISLKTCISAMHFIVSGLLPKIERKEFGRSDSALRTHLERSRQSTSNYRFVSKGTCFAARNVDKRAAVNFSYGFLAYFCLGLYLQSSFRYRKGVFPALANDFGTCAICLKCGIKIDTTKTNKYFLVLANLNTLRFFHDAWHLSRKPDESHLDAHKAIFSLPKWADSSANPKLQHLQNDL